MRYVIRPMTGVMIVLLACAAPTAGAADKDDEMVENPYYKHWHKFKPGSTVTLSENTAFKGEEKADLPDGVDHKTVTYKLLSVSNDKVVVQTVVVETDFLSRIESAPTKITYPAKVKKAHLLALFEEFHAKTSEATIKVGKKEYKCKLFSGTKKTKDSEIDAKIWLSTEVPGGIVKRTRTTREGGKVVADTTIEIVSYKTGK